jgi:AcrR family transcriptional regulator
MAGTIFCIETLIRFHLDEHANMLHAANRHPRLRVSGLAIFSLNRMSDWSLTHWVGECVSVRNCKKEGLMRSARSPRALGSRALSRRSHLLETSRRLFVEQGFHQTGIAQIATASDIAVGQIYRDFESKEAIIEAICQSDVEAWLEESALADAVANQDLDAIRRWLERFGSRDQPEDRYRLVAEIIAEAGRNARVAEIYRRVDDRVRHSLTAALAALVPENTPTELVSAAAEHILRLGAGAACRRIAHPQQCTARPDQWADTPIFDDLDQWLCTLGDSAVPAKRKRPSPSSR